MSSEDLSSRRVRTDAYDLGEVAPVEGFASVDPGTNVLISGGRMLGKERLALELLAAGSEEEEAIAVTPDTAGGRLRDSFESVAGGLDRLRVVDCTGASSKGSFDDTDDMKYVASPGDLTGIGMGIVKCTRDMGESVDGLRLAVFSLSTLLRYSDPDRVFNFLHTVTGRVSAADYLGIATLDPGAHDPQDVNTLSSQFDVVVELREADDDGREARVVGHHESPRTWKAL
jgi:hypothetical protein